MFRILFTICLAMFTLLTPAPALAAECGPATKIVQMRRFAFLPDIQWMCSGQAVAVVNGHNEYITVRYWDGYGRQIDTPWIRPGSYFLVYAPTTMIARTYGRYSYTLKNGVVKLGMAPDSY